MHRDDRCRSSDGCGKRLRVHSARCIVDVDKRHGRPGLVNGFNGGVECVRDRDNAVSAPDPKEWSARWSAAVPEPTPTA